MKASTCKKSNITFSEVIGFGFVCLLFSGAIAGVGYLYVTSDIVSPSIECKDHNGGVGICKPL